MFVLSTSLVMREKVITLYMIPYNVPLHRYILLSFNGKTADEPTIQRGRQV